MIFILQEQSQPEPPNTLLNGFSTQESGNRFEAEGFVVDGDFMAKGQYSLRHYTYKESERNGHTYEQNFSVKEAQYRGVPCDSNLFDRKAMNLDVHRYYLPLLSEEYLFFHDYFHDKDKPNHQKSMEKEMTSWAYEEGFTVKYWGACGNRAFFQRWVFPNEEEIPRLGEGVRKALTTAEYVFKHLLFQHKQVVIG